MVRRERLGTQLD